MGEHVKDEDLPMARAERCRMEEREKRERGADLVDARVQLPVDLPIGLHLSRVLVALRGRLVEAFVDERLVAQTLALHLYENSRIREAQRSMSPASWSKSQQ